MIMKLASFHSLLSLLLLIGFAMPGFAQDAAEDGFTPLFNGENLDGWAGDPAIWSVRDGAITGTTTEENSLKYNTFLIWQEGEVDDFILRFEYKITDPGNSGVQYRSWEGPENQKWRVGGYQADFDGNNRFAGILYGEQFRGILANRGQKTVIGENGKPTVEEQFATSEELQKHIKPAGEWNEYEVTARGFEFTHKINGQVMSQCRDEDASDRRRNGILAVQCHVGPPMQVQVRNLRLKRLPLEDAEKIVFLAGNKSHGYAGHEHNAGCRLLAEYMNQHVPGTVSTVYLNGWPDDPTALDNADVVVVFCDGGGRHMFMNHLDELNALKEKGVGFVALHYAVEMPPGPGGDFLKEATGGYFEVNWSVNPHFKAEFTEFVDHPVTRGLKPFEIDDEWYYHMRFKENMEGVTPVLTCVPPDATRERRMGAHSNNPTVKARKGEPEHVGWVVEREDGGRGFGFTGGHWHWNWAEPNFRKIVINGIAWTAGLDIPEGGIETPTPSFEKLLENQDFPSNLSPEKEKRIREMIEDWNK